MTRRGSGQGGRGRGGDRFMHQRENKYVGKGKRTQYRSDRNEYYSEEKRSNHSRDGGGFRKFTGTNSMSPRGYKSDQHHNYNNSRNYNDDNAWPNNQMANSNPFSISQNVEMENRKDEPENTPQPSKPIAPVEQQVESNDKSDQPTAAPKHKHKSPKVKPEPPSSDESSSEEEEAKPAAKPKSTEVSNSVPKIKIKKERVHSTPEKKEVVTKVPIVTRTSAPPPQAESSSSDSSSCSSSEEEEPKMPQPMRGGDVHPKKEKKSEDDVVCLGKMNNIENLTADSDDATVCIVCSKSGHPSDECQTKCRKCSSSSYQCQVVCKKCGETYTDGIKSAHKLPDPFSMFMQFMQFYMQQYGGDTNAETNYQFPPFENPVHLPEPSPTVEVSRKDIENSKTNRKRIKTESKQSKKKSRRNSQSSSDDDSDSNSRAASSIKKRKKRAKSFTRDTETPPVAQQHQPYGHHFPPTYPSSMPFTGPFNAPGFNPMMAFSQMMGYNPAAMNFKR